jgi:hypothetical protein
MRQFIPVLLGICLFFIFLPETNLTNSDIGRHLKNGEIIIKTFSVPKTNLYSYTYPEFLFYNHHWLSGVIFYFVNKISGFKGLAIFISLITFLTFFIFYNSVKEESSNWLLLVIFILVVPIICVRKEIRPEIFSYFFTSIYFYCLYRFVNKGEKNILFFLPLIQLFWVNIHIYFFIGLLLILFAILEKIYSFLATKNRKLLYKIKSLSFIFLLCIVSSIFNPYGIKGFLFPFNIFKNYGYTVFENQSVWFIDRVVKNYLPNLNYKILLTILIISWGIKINSVFTKKISLPIFNILCSLFTLLISLFAIRNFAIFGYFCIPILVSNFVQTKIFKKNFLMVLISVLTFYAIYKTNPYIWKINVYNFGLKTNNHLAAQFFINNNLKGPILNNYDIGGYLIYFLYPKEKVFVDNRPEAYPENFFKTIYIPMMENETKWLEVDKTYNFNTIFFYLNDYTPWGQQFLINRVFDKNWAVVFVDQDCIILLKRNLQNKEIIEKFELPKDMFRVVKTV